MKYYINMENLALGGFAPKWYAETYSSYGNKNQAGDMTNIDCTNVPYIQQAPGLENLTGGTNLGKVSTLLKGILSSAASSDLTYGVGGNMLYSFSSTAVTNNATFPHTIAKLVVTGESGEDVCLFQNNLYYSYNHTNSVGSSTTQFDITNPSAKTFTYTWDSTGTNPAITAITFPVGSQVTINIADASVGNNGTFTIIASGSNYFSITNPAGLAENDKTIGAGSLVVLAGEIGQYDLVSTFNDDWATTIPSGMASLIGGVPHQMIGGGSVGVDTMYIANGKYIADWDGTTFVPQDLDFPTGSEVQSIAWMSDRIWCAVNKTNLTGTNKNAASIYTWDGNDTTWESEIPLMGKVGGLHVKNGILYLFYQDITNTGGYKLAYLNGSSVVDVANFTGTLPEYYQITDYKDFIIWNSSGSIWAYGSGDKDLPPRLFQLADGGYATVGGIACPFGTPVIASTDSTNYRLAKFSGYDVNCTWKSLIFDITGNGSQSTIDSVRFNFEKLESGARVDWSLVNNRGETIYSDTISYAKLGAVTTAYYPLNGKKQENFRIELSYANGSTTTTVKIKNIKVNGSIN